MIAGVGYPEALFTGSDETLERLRRRIDTNLVLGLR